LCRLAPQTPGGGRKRPKTGHADAADDCVDMRARIKKRQRNRNITIVAIVVLAIILVVAASYSLYSLTVKSSPLIGQPVSASIYSGLSQIAASSTYGPDNPSLVSIKSGSNPSGVVQTVSGQPYTSGGKPVVLYIGGEFCPLCAFQRWPLTIALMRFGNVTGLEYMQSSSTDSDPNTSTFSFIAAHYSSKYFVFQSYEQEDRDHNPLQTVPNNYSSVFASFGSGYPFLNFGNKYVVEGSFFEPTAFAGLNWTQILQQVQNPNTQIYTQVMSSANAITALICNLTGGSPASVCNNSSITGLQISPAAFQQPSGSGPAVSTAFVTRARNDVKLV
jgi:hypothetical protein